LVLNEFGFNIEKVFIFEGDIGGCDLVFVLMPSRPGADLKGVMPSNHEKKVIHIIVVSVVEVFICQLGWHFQVF